ncbi:hypothetical protein GLS40_00130 [Pseudooceanicola sp. 216_PA32_1]|uniref:Cyclic di-GMP-binding protein n=1 Tax=Pseudooceanicola pacificus TaxID=2676438 RepID=A0A844W0S2_9RHOB|nr:cellulose biosynthesis cyclic di-GMP-binding regulatory protein BcsB [Pseudooceanicola pacificus]MWB76421.1 hypothetical protein [Pseudooceanicola pacificus]
MNPFRTSGAALRLSSLALAAALATQAGAQSITLQPAPQQQSTDRVASAAVPMADRGTGLTAAPSNEAPQATPDRPGAADNVPIIRLPAMPGMSGTPETTGSTGGGTVMLDALPVADRASIGMRAANHTQPAPAEIPRKAEWVMPLMPADGIPPRQVSTGASMPQPGIIRLTGEIAEAHFLLDMPATEENPAELVLNLRSSVNVLPDASSITVRVNDQPPVTLPLDKLGPFEPLRLRNPGLQTGRNDIRIEVTQAHRIYCGPDASFDTWTEIDLGSSGVSVPADSLPLNGDGFLAAVRAQTALTRSIEVLGDDEENLAAIEEISRYLGASAGWAPRIKFGSFYDVGNGSPERARIAIIKSDRDAVTFRRGAQGAIVMLVEHTDGAAPDFSGILPAPPAPAVVNAAQVGRATTFAELDVPLVIGNNHYFRKDVPFVLPDDWLLMASQKARIDLYYGYSNTLAEGSMLLVKVNGETVQMLPLDVDGGDIKPRLEIPFPANILNAGINRISFEMIVPGDPADLQCVPRATDMLVILGDSSITIPGSPSMTRNDMRTALDRMSGENVIIPTPARSDPDRDAALLMPFAMRFQPLTREGSASVLNVITPQFVDAVPTGDTGLKRRVLQQVLTGVQVNFESPALQPIVVPQKNAAPAPSFRLSMTNDTVDTAAGADEDAAEPMLAGLFDLPNMWATGVAQFERLRDFASADDPDLTTWLARRTGEAVLMQLDPEDPNNLWLVVRPTADMNEIAERIDEFRLDGHVKGNLAVLSSDGTWETWNAGWHPRLAEPLEAGNIRTVLGNYASWSPITFTALTLLLALVSAVPALIYVVSTRRKGSRT